MQSRIFLTLTFFTVLNCLTVLATPIAKLNAIEHPIERRNAILENMVRLFDLVYK